MLTELHFVEAWEPTSKEYAAYRRREHELAKENISQLFARYGNAAHEDTLHSLETFESAYAAVIVERTVVRIDQIA